MIFLKGCRLRISAENNFVKVAQVQAVQVQAAQVQAAQVQRKSNCFQREAKSLATRNFDLLRKIFKRNKISDFQSGWLNVGFENSSKPKAYVNATMLNVYLFYRPEQVDRRTIFRKYVKMWRDINSPDMIPFKYFLVTASTPETVQEDLVNEDMLLFEGFDESYMNT